MSSSSLYGNTGNVTVSSKNLTTLYNATTGNTVVANVPDRNFTTLYSAAGQTDIKPTRPYGNANVEAFLNTGSDGANTVQNITMNGVLTVGGDSYLGDVSGVHIEGGSPGYALVTDGYGNLIWTFNGGDEANAVPYIHFDVSSTGNNQQFSNVNISFYQDENYFSLFKNGINLEPSQYAKIANNTVQVNVPLVTGDDIDILPSAGGSGGGGTPGGSIGMIQFNSGYGFGGDSNFTVDTNTGVLSASYLAGDGSNITGIIGGANTQVQFNDGGQFNGESSFTYDKTQDLLGVINLEVSSVDNLGSGIEKVILANTVGSTYTFNCNVGSTANSIVLVNDNASGNFQIDFVNLSLDTSTCRTFTFINHNDTGLTYVCNGVKIDGVTATVNWLGGSAPTIGNTYDVYTFNFFKTDVTTYLILGAKGGF